MLRATSAIPRRIFSTLVSCELIKATAAYVVITQPISGNIIFFQLIFRHSAMATPTDVRALMIEESMFASVYKSMYGKNIMANIPKPKPVTL